MSPLTGGERYSTGAPAASVADAHRYPSCDEIEKAMREITPRLHARLASLDDTYLAAPARMQLPGTNTVADELGFFAQETNSSRVLRPAGGALSTPGP